MSSSTGKELLPINFYYTLLFEVRRRIKSKWVKHFFNLEGLKKLWIIFNLVFLMSRTCSSLTITSAFFMTKLGLKQSYLILFQAKQEFRLFTQHERILVRALSERYSSHQTSARSIPIWRIKNSKWEQHHQCWWCCWQGISFQHLKSQI